MKSAFFIRVVLVMSLLTPSAFSAERKVITLTDTKGRNIQAEIIALKDDSVETIVNGKEIVISLEKLSEESRQTVKDTIAAQRKAQIAENAEKLKLPDGKAITPGRVQTFTMTVTEAQKEWSKTDLLSYKASVAFPSNFDPSKSYPIYFVNDTLPGKNADRVKAVAKAANKAGYVVIGAQALKVGKGKDPATHNMRGYATNITIFELLKNWPLLKDSAWYFGGNSGGAKNCCFLSVYLYEVYDNPPAGFFMGGCNEMMMIKAIDAFKSDKKSFLKTAFFVSNGNKDKIAAPAMGKKVAAELKKGRFKTVRQEVFEGGHAMSSEQFTKALKWFDQLREETKK